MGGECECRGDAASRARIAMFLMPLAGLQAQLAVCAQAGFGRCHPEAESQACQATDQDHECDKAHGGRRWAVGFVILGGDHSDQITPAPNQSQRNRSRAKYVRIRSAPARLMPVVISTAVLRKSIQPLSAA